MNHAAVILETSLICHASPQQVSLLKLSGAHANYNRFTSTYALLATTTFSPPGPGLAHTAECNG